MKVLKTVVTVVGVVAAVVATAGLLAPVAVGAALGTVGLSLATVSAIGAAASIAGGILNSLTAKKPSSLIGGSATDWKADPQAGIPYMVGRTFNAGNIVKRESWGTDNEWQGFTTVYSLGPVGSIEQFTADRNPISFNSGGNAIGGMAGWMYLWMQLGLCPTPVAMQNVIGYPGWSASSKLSGLAASNWFLKFDKKDGKKYSLGIPSPGIISTGVLVYDPRLDDTQPGGSGACRAGNEATYVSSESPALHTLTWALGRYQNNKRRMGVGFPASSIDVLSFISWANVCDANNWKIGGIVYSTDDKWNILKTMAQAGGAEPMQLGGKLSVNYSAPRVSVATITSKDMVGRGTVVASQKKRDRINGIVPRIKSEAHGWQVVPLDVVRVPTLVAEDGRDRTKERDYQLVQQVKQGAELAAYDIYNAREFGPIELKLKVQYIGLPPGSAVTLDIPEMNLNGQKALLGQRTLDVLTGAVSMQFKSETDAKHPFCLGKTGVAPPTPSLSAPLELQTPAPQADDWIMGGILLTSASGTQPCLRFAGTVDNANAEGVIFEYRIAGTTEWISGSVHGPNTTKADITSLVPGASYEGSIRYVFKGVAGDRRITAPVATGAITGTLPAWSQVLDDGYKPANNATVGAIIGGNLVTTIGNLPGQAQIITAEGTAAAIAGQGPGATAIGNDVLNNRTEGGVTFIPAPVGGTFNGTAISMPGAFKIRLPQFFQDSMVKFTVDIYDYDEGTSTSYTVGGYLYNYAGGAWLSHVAQMQGTRNRSLSVRFGHDGVKACIWIGDPGTIHRHPQVRVRDAAIGFTNNAISDWDDGWSVTLDTAAATNVSQIVLVPRSNDAVFGEGVFEIGGGATATLPNFKTPLGTAAAIANQGALATRGLIEDGFVGGPLAVRIAPHPLNGNFLGAATIAYTDGQHVQNLRPSEAGSNVTETRVAAAISSQGTLATRNGMKLGGTLGLYEGLYDETLSYQVTNSQAITAIGTAAAIANQADWATYTGLNTGIVANRTSQLDNFNGNFSGLDRISNRRITLLNRADGVSGITEPDIVTALGVSSAIAGQGPGATAIASEVMNNRLEGGVLNVARPVGAQFSGGSGTVGAFKISLPMLNTSTMIKFNLNVYDYVTGRSSTFIISGYAYQAQLGAPWYNTSAQYIGPRERSLPVRFGHDGVKLCIWVGDPGTVSQYPQVVVTDFSGGYADQDPSTWNDGWSITMDTNPSTNVVESTLVPRPGDAVYGEGIYEIASGAIATKANFKTAEGTAAAIVGQAAAATDHAIEAGADVTSFVVGSATFNIEAASDGTPTAALLPKLVGYKLMKNASDLTASATWSRTLLSGGLTSTISAGQLSVTGMTTDEAVVRLQAALGSVTRTIDVKVIRNKAAAAPPSGGGTSANTSVFYVINSTSQTVASPELEINVGASGTATLSAPLEFYALSSVGTFGLNLRWQRWNGSAWVDVGSVATSDPSAIRYNEGAGEIYSEPGFINCSATVNGLSGAQKFRLTGYTPAGTVSRSCVGTASAVGS